jgi:phage terminase large subunit-like protein
MRLAVTSIPDKSTLGRVPLRGNVQPVPEALRFETMFATRQEETDFVSACLLEYDEEQNARRLADQMEKDLDRDIEVVHVGPQEGKQTKFASCTADICIYGGAAGGGKSFSLLLEDLPHVHLQEFASVTFRRTYKQIRLPGGLWDKSCALYRKLGAKPIVSNHEHLWPSGARSTFSHLEHESDIYDWQGGQIALMKFDELTHFTETQFWYLTSRLRSTCGIKPYIRCTTNPEPNSWVARLIDWWIGNDGYPIELRDGVVRWFCRLGNDLLWGDSREEVMALKPETTRDDEWEPTSLAFISANLDDNPELTNADPKYRSVLAALPLYERELLLKGNWKIRPGKGMRFKRDWFEIVDKVPDLTGFKRYWDRAGTEVGPLNKDPDWTAGVKGGFGNDQCIYITDVERFRKTAGAVQNRIGEIAKADGCIQEECQLWLEQDPAQAGKYERFGMSIGLERYMPRFVAPSGNRYVRSGPASVAAENKRIKLVRGPWNEFFLSELENFVDERVVDLPPGYHDDCVTAFVGLYERMMVQEDLK